MRKLGLVMLAFALALEASGWAAPQPGDRTQESVRGATRPNILFILADDLGSEASALYPELYDASSPSALGQAPTPTLGALAARGLVFDNAWARPLCSPTRAALLTGLHGHNTGVTTVNQVLPGNTTSIFESLATAATAARYSMATFGKWHLGMGIGHVVNDTGVPLFRGFLGGLINNYYDWTVVSSTSEPVKTTVYSTTALTDFTIDFIRSQAGSQPWFVYLAYNAPHGARPGDGFQVPPAGLFTVDVGGRPAGAPTVYDGAIPVYQAMVQALDTEMGRLFRAMDEAGQLDDTVIIFMGDNGTPASVKDPAARIRGSKRSVYEGGVRVPLVVAGPGVTRRGRESRPVAAEDIYATIAQLAGVPTTDNAFNDGYSLVPLFGSDQAGTGRTYSFTELCGPVAGSEQFAIRDHRYKLLYSNDTWEFFDLERDPWETTNLYESAEQARPRADLLRELRALRTKAATTGCFVDIPAS